MMERLMYLCPFCPSGQGQPDPMPKWNGGKIRGTHRFPGGWDPILLSHLGFGFFIPHDHLGPPIHFINLKPIFRTNSQSRQTLRQGRYTFTLDFGRRLEFRDFQDFLLGVGLESDRIALCHVFESSYPISFGADTILSTCQLT